MKSGAGLTHAGQMQTMGHDIRPRPGWAAREKELGGGGSVAMARAEVCGRDSGKKEGVTSLDPGTGFTVRAAWFPT